mmetsp:Transcript_67170/g.165789  ORF Transcript_67170/g.165789 Transcript_67170/m.165789 type:complete len:238 (-) Transcript_67170:1459-2172(-)
MLFTNHEAVWIVQEPSPVKHLPGHCVPGSIASTWSVGLVPGHGPRLPGLSSVSTDPQGIHPAHCGTDWAAAPHEEGTLTARLSDRAQRHLHRLRPSHRRVVPECWQGSSMQKVHLEKGKSVFVHHSCDNLGDMRPALGIRNVEATEPLARPSEATVRRHVGAKHEPRPPRHIGPSPKNPIWMVLHNLGIIVRSKRRHPKPRSQVPVKGGLGRGLQTTRKTSGIRGMPVAPVRSVPIV